MNGRETYPPLNILKPVAEDVWIVDGPAIRFGPRWFSMPFPTRMTVIRTGTGLFIHSPTALPDPLRAEIEKLGPPRWIAGPNRIHYWWIPDWHRAFPDAEVYLAPKTGQSAKGRIDFPANALDRMSGYPWDREIATLPVAGRFMTEAVFFHKRSRTLVLADFIENFEPRKLGWFMRLLTRLGGANGSMPRDMRLTYRDRKALRAAVMTMIEWGPERVIIAHGRWFERDGVGALRRAFSWLLD